MAKMSIDELKNDVTNFQRSYMWEVLVPTPIGDGQMETFLLRAQSSQIPSRSNAQIAIPFKQTAGVVVAGKLEYTHTWTCEFVEGEDRAIYNAFHTWQEKMVGENTGIGIGDPAYKTDVYISLLKLDGTISMRLKLKGSWIQNVAEVPLAYADNEIIRYSVTFAFDSIEDAN